MFDETIETQAHTTHDGRLNLSMDVGLSDADVRVTVHVRVLHEALAKDEKGWPEGYFERVCGSMPELERPPQGGFEERLSLE